MAGVEGVSQGRKRPESVDVAAIAARLDAAVEEWAHNGVVAFRMVGLDGLPVVAPAITTFLANAPEDMAALLAMVRSRRAS